MADGKHKQRFIVLVKTDGKWQRSISVPEPFYVKAEAETAAEAHYAGTCIAYKIRTK